MIPLRPFCLGMALSFLVLCVGSRRLQYGPADCEHIVNHSDSVAIVTAFEHIPFITSIRLLRHAECSGSPKCGPLR